MIFEIIQTKLARDTTKAPHNNLQTWIFLHQRRERLPVFVAEARDLLGLLQNEFLQLAGEERVLEQLDLHATRLVQHLRSGDDSIPVRALRNVGMTDGTN